LRKYHGKDLSTNDFTDGYKKKIDSMSTIYRYKGSVNTYDDLSFIENRNIGDSYKCKEDSNTYIWDGIGWSEGGQDVDFSEILEQIDTYQEEVNTQINEVNEQLTNIEQEGIIVSSTEPATNRRKVWMQNIEDKQKIYVLNDNNVYEEFMKKEADVYSTEEIKTNKLWIDGKPLYRKVITGSTTNTELQLSTPPEIETMARYEIYNGNLKSSSRKLPSTEYSVNHGNTIFDVMWYKNDWIKNAFYIVSNNIKIGSVTIIIEYTKTTD